jgi:GntP family gluconate:H+ symporter
MAGATASTTAGATIAAQTFAGALTDAGVPALAAAATVHAGATVVDSLPHGSFFHATGGSVFMTVSERLKLIPYEAAVGLAATAASCCRWLV